MAVIVGVLLRLALSALLFFVAWLVLEPRYFSRMLGDLAERHNHPRDTYDYLNDYQPRLRQLFYLLALVYLVLTGTFTYHHLRRLPIQKDLANAARPYSPSGSGSPGATTTSGGTSASPAAAPQSAPTTQSGGTQAATGDQSQVSQPATPAPSAGAQSTPAAQPSEGTSQGGTTSPPAQPAQEPSGQ